jgi:UDPglucose 6-dehydrogenase
MRVTIVGTGYVGLVSGTCFAEMGNNVVCVDIDEAKVDQMRAGQLPIFEPGLELFFERNLKDERLTFTTSLEDGVKHGDVIFLALPTPPSDDGSADLSYVMGVAQEIAEMQAADPAIGYKIIVDKSTVPVGTAGKVTEVMEAAGLSRGEHFDVVSNPEFLREGVAVDDFMKPERVVIGTDSERASDIMTQLYEPFVRQGNAILTMDTRSAEMTKYAANSLLATRISFMNEIANVCERVGANVDDVRIGIGQDSRIGKRFLYSGIGFGGSCFPKDVQALHRTAKAHDYDFKVLDAVLTVNDRQRVRLAEDVVAHFDGDLEGKRIGVWGLAFKPNTDDIREAPSHIIIRHLQKHGAKVQAFDPEAMGTTREMLGDTIVYAADAYSALDDVDALIICTEWHEFRRPDFMKMHRRMKQPLVFDGRNVYHPERMAELGFEYYSIGRPHFAPTKEPAVSLMDVDVSNEQPV